MAKQIIFISSVQQEFAAERQELFAYLQADPLLGLFFEPFLFERLPAIDQRTDEVDGVDSTSTAGVPQEYRRSSEFIKSSW